MAKSILLRALVTLCFSVIFGSHNHSAGFLPTTHLADHVSPVFAEHPRFFSIRAAIIPTRVPEMEKGHFFQFLVEEEAHIHTFCFDRLRKRRRFCRLICFLTRLSLLFIHLNIILYHADHLLHHQLHYFLKGLL